ncbi:MAG: universal stress protein [Bacteroidota bacterium]
MKKLIVPTDFSEFSLCGLELAILYANKYKSDIQLVHVLNTKKSRYKTTESSEKEISAEQLENIVNDFKGKLHKDGKLDYIVKSGRIFEEVAEQAEAIKDSAVFCSTHGESGLSNIFIGSNTHRIVEGTIRPVFSVGSSKQVEPPKTIVMPIDITKETREKVTLVASIAKKFGSKVHILKVTTSTSEGIHNTLKMYASQVAKYFDERDIEYEKSLIVGDNITDVTIEYAKTVEANLIAIMTEQTKSLTNLLMGSYAQQMLNNSPVPVVSVTPYELTVNESSFRTMGG